MQHRKNGVFSENFTVLIFLNMPFCCSGATISPLHKPESYDIMCLPEYQSAAADFISAKRLAAANQLFNVGFLPQRFGNAAVFFEYNLAIANQ